jgi:hypothetical protein
MISAMGQAGQNSSTLEWKAGFASDRNREHKDVAGWLDSIMPFHPAGQLRVDIASSMNTSDMRAKLPLLISRPISSRMHACALIPIF